MVLRVALEVVIDPNFCYR